LRRIGYFDYGGGHFQKYAVDLGLGALDTRGLAAEINRMLGHALDVAYDSPSPAGGGAMDPGHYARFLRAILSRDLAISHRLGAHAVCTLPGACPTSRQSPAAPYVLHYSYGHWVEDDPAGDGAFSSPGLFGFYPWIDASKSHYGIVARHAFARNAYMESAQCGHAIRRAFVTGMVQ
jgi:hypothetical protein